MAVTFTEIKAVRDKYPNHHIYLLSGDDIIRDGDRFRATVPEGQEWRDADDSGFWDYWMDGYEIVNYSFNAKWIGKTKQQVDPSDGLVIMRKLKFEDTVPRLVKTPITLPPPRSIKFRCPHCRGAIEAVQDLEQFEAQKGVVCPQN